MEHRLFQMPFRSTLPRGERPLNMRSRAPRRCFDPRSRAGSDGNAPRPAPRRRRFDPRSRAGSVGKLLSWRVDVSEFRSTLPRGERPARRCCDTGPRCFDPRSRAGSDRRAGVSFRTMMRFRSTLPRGERRALYPKVLTRLVFRSTLPRGERRACPRNWRRFVLFRSTLPRGERRGGRRDGTRYPVVSIHAPARGATLGLLTPQERAERFDPRSRAGSDSRTNSAGAHRRAFRSTLPRGERPSSFGAWTPRPRGVSIHAPARGATRVLARYDLAHGVSIHAPARGATTRRSSGTGRPVFRSTLPRGERLAEAVRARTAERFDPRSRAGSDRAARRPLRGDLRFDPRSRAGSDQRGAEVGGRHASFRSTLPRGERRRRRPRR